MSTPSKDLFGRVISRNKNDCLISHCLKLSHSFQSQNELIKIHFAKKDTEVFTGDYVHYQIHSNQSQNPKLTNKNKNIGHRGKLIKVVKPKSQFFRQDQFGHKKIIARNLSQVALLVALKPKVNFLSIDATIALCTLNQCKLMIIVNKCDLPESQSFFKGIERYLKAGVEIIYTSIFYPESLEQLKTKLNNQCTLFFGISGVGKSSLIQNFFPKQTIKIQGLVEKTRLGKHTTSQARLYQNECFELIDTPGMGNETISYFDNTTLAHLFVDFKPFLNHCKFRNCNHSKRASGCALTEAARTGKIHAKRLSQYQKLMEEFCFKKSLS